MEGDISAKSNLKVNSSLHDNVKNFMQLAEKKNNMIYTCILHLHTYMYPSSTHIHVTCRKGSEEKVPMAILSNDAFSQNFDGWEALFLKNQSSISQPKIFHLT